MKKIALLSFALTLLAAAPTVQAMESGGKGEAPDERKDSGKSEIPEGALVRIPDKEKLKTLVQDVDADFLEGVGILDELSGRSMEYKKIISAVHVTHTRYTRQLILALQTGRLSRADFEKKIPSLDNAPDKILKALLTEEQYLKRHDQFDCGPEPCGLL